MADQHSTDPLQDDVSTHFRFGENWSEFARNLSEDRIGQARDGLLRLMNGEEIRGASFLDIGCGSGVHSLAALQLGAKSVEAMDFDPQSVATCRRVLQEHWKEDNYQVRIGSILKHHPTTEKRFDVVYSWGVLHHTGAMWTAIENAAQWVLPGGLFVIAIYVKTPFCPIWKMEKAVFSRSPKWVQTLITLVFGAFLFFRIALGGKNPVRYIRAYQNNRGMSWWHDQIDWLGGYPYESASEKEILSFVMNLGFEPIKTLHTRPGIGIFGTGCGEYVFRRRP